MWLLILVIGLPPAIIAHSKGRNFFLWYLYGTALFIAALPYAIVIKPLEPELDRHRRGGEFASSSKRKKCPDCAELIAAEARVCRFCGWRTGSEIAQPSVYYVNPRYTSASSQSGWPASSKVDSPIPPATGGDPGWGKAVERMRSFDKPLNWRRPSYGE